MKINSALMSLVLCCCCTSAFAAQSLAGHVLNGTSNKPSAGDQVILLRLGEGMQEESRTTTQADGTFLLRISSPGSAHLVRVIHQGVNYDQKVDAAGRVDVEVFDAVDRVPGLTAKVGMAQVQSQESGLLVTEMYQVVNGSTPPVTQRSLTNFEFSLLPNAALESFQARRRTGIWVNLKPSAIPGKESRYAVDFPIRPGDTLFRFAYRLPYSGIANLKITPAYPLESFAVMHPPAMEFKTQHSADFTSPGMTRGLRLEQLTNRSGLIREIPEFEISGGAPAAITPLTPNRFESSTNQSTPTGTQAATPDSDQALGLVAAGIVFFAAVIFALLRKRAGRQKSAPAMQQSAGSAR